MKRTGFVLILLAVLAHQPLGAMAAPVNLALGKPVTGSAFWGEAYPFAKVNDGR